MSQTNNNNNGQTGYSQVNLGGELMQQCGEQQQQLSISRNNSDNGQLGFHGTLAVSCAQQQQPQFQDPTPASNNLHTIGQLGFQGATGGEPMQSYTQQQSGDQQ
jgi:hypothetical protein